MLQFTKHLLVQFSVYDIQLLGIRLIMSDLNNKLYVNSSWDSFLNHVVVSPSAKTFTSKIKSANLYKFCKRNCDSG